MSRKRVLEVNRVFLMTVLFSIVGFNINGIILNFTDNYFITLITSQIILVLPTGIYLIKNKIKLSKLLEKMLTTSRMYLGCSQVKNWM